MIIGELWACFQRAGTAALCVGCVLTCLLASVPAEARPRLFGSVEFQMELKQKNWLDALERNRRNPVFFDDNRLTASVTWKSLKEKASGKTLREQLGIVNRFWNMWPYRSDQELYGKKDYWAAPCEFLKTSGDCEDYCIAKYFTLKELGVPVGDMRIVVVRETIRGAGHAVLAVYDGDDIWILDNLADAVRPANRVRNYAPQFSVNEKHRWVYVRAR